jgi:hypothetical protein
MDTRRLLARMAELLGSDAEGLMNLPEGPKDRLRRRRKDIAYFNPSPEEIRAATLVIQTEWSEHERMVRAGGSAATRRWRVPLVRVLGTPEVGE